MKKQPPSIENITSRPRGPRVNYANVKMFVLFTVILVVLALVLTACKKKDIAATAPGKCDRSYPTVCIPPPPPDLDCNQVKFRRFKVVGADPHHFDRDRDGVGCE
ncbi:MAG: hypothetical protein EXR44_02225 [Dehalococcoidia bacterium]|nr:hypothetical protein [Dehalococcoidia bacterium]